MGFTHPRAALASAASILVLLSQPARSAGFLNFEQSASAAAVATAGQAASGEDASTIFYNPAGLALLDNAEFLSAAGIGIRPMSFSNDGTRDSTGRPVTGNDNADVKPFVLPDMFVALPISRDLHVGLGAFVPFGQANRYDEGWVGRYQLQQIVLHTADISLAASYRATDWLAIGASVDPQYARLKRSTAIDFGSLCNLFLSGAGCGLLGLTPQGADGHLAADVSDWAVGYDVGALFVISPDIRVGVNYRSAVRHDLSGTAHFFVPAAATPLAIGSGAFKTGPASSNVIFPDLIGLGLNWRLNSQLTGLLGLSLTRWSHLQELSLNFANPRQTPISQPLEWHDTVRVSIGAEYALDDMTGVRGGFAFDQSPTVDKTRSADLPETNSYMVGMGITRRVSDSMILTAAYNIVWDDAATVNLSQFGEGTLAGRVSQVAHVLGLQAELDF